MKLTKAEWEALPAPLKKLFKQDGDDYVMETPEDVESLKRARDRERDEAKSLREQIKELKTQVASLAETDEQKRLEAERKAGDIKALEQSWQTKLEKREKELQTQLEQRDAALKRLLVTNEAQKLAREISTVPDLMADRIAARLSAEFDGDTPTTRVLDADGKPSALSLEDLKKEILADKRYSGVLIAGKATGGGAGGGGSGGGAAKLEDFKNQDGTVNWSKVNQAHQANPDAGIIKMVQESLQPGAGQAGVGGA